MKFLFISCALVVLFGATSLGCHNADSCTQDDVDGCYQEVGCDGSETCSLTTDEMNQLCVCLGDHDCDQDWYHSFCDDAPYEEGECVTCDDEPDASP